MHVLALLDRVVSLQVGEHIGGRRGGPGSTFVNAAYPQINMTNIVTSTKLALTLSYYNTELVFTSYLPQGTVSVHPVLTQTQLAQARHRRQSSNINTCSRTRIRIIDHTIFYCTGSIDRPVEDEVPSFERQSPGQQSTYDDILLLRRLYIAAQREDALTHVRLGSGLIPLPTLKRVLSSRILIHRVQLVHAFVA